RELSRTITRLTGIVNADLAGALPPESAVAEFTRFAFRDGVPWLLGHNVGFDVAFLERSGMPIGAERIDTAELASIVLPSAPSYALQRLAADAAITPVSAHRALDDAITSALVLGHLARIARGLPPLVLSEIAAVSAFEPDGPLATSMHGYEDRPEQRELAAAIERTLADGGALVAEAGTGVGKSIAYIVPLLGAAAAGERGIVSTHTLPLQDQLVRKDIPAVQAALGTEVKVAVLKGRANYLCPRRWQIFRGAVATREEARLLSKTLVWRSATETGDRAELNLMSGESELWSRISANDESCDQ